MPTELESFAMNKLEPAVFPHDARLEAASLGPSQTLLKGRVLGKKIADSKLYPYASGNADGTQVPVAILTHDTVTDANGKHYLGTSGVASSMNLPHGDGQVYVAGTFHAADLIGWDANAATVMHARVLPSGDIRIP
ncbi:MAG TPA: head decoration protein [Tepidisphaeraceae bacterium]|jgi:hypothetical protein|nr:head decoration protein [Tepidisphaeraceae bacterium]